MDWGVWILSCLYIATPIVIFAGRNWIKASIERGVQHSFDTKLELFRAELKQRQDILASGLRAKEGEIAALRDVVLSGRAQRQALVDKRRIEAIEIVWKNIIMLAPHKAICSYMAEIDLQAAAKNAAYDPKIRDRFKALLCAGSPDHDLLNNNPAINERPFISPIAWAYFCSYLTIISMTFSIAKMLSDGNAYALDIKVRDDVLNLLRETLPDEAALIDTRKPLNYYQLLDRVETFILAEFERMLRGEEQDANSVQQAARIMALTHEVRGSSVTASIPAMAPSSSDA